MSSKLKNIDAITKMLEGTHRTQTRQSIGFSGIDKIAEQNKKREVGEEWAEYDTEGNVVCYWRQEKGYKRRLAKNYKAIEQVREILNSYPNCLPENKKCKTTPKNRLDRRFQAKFGRCADCQSIYESRLKLEGKYKEYERQQLLANAESFFKNADTEIEIVAEQLRSNMDYANQDGTMDRWKASGDMASQLIEEYNEYKEIVLKKLKEEEE